MTDTQTKRLHAEPFDLFSQVATSSQDYPSDAKMRTRKRLLERIQDAVYDVYGVQDYDPAVQLALIAMDESTPIDIRAAAHAKIMPYVHSAMPQIKVDLAPEQALTQQNEMVDGILKIIDVVPTGVKIKDSEPT